MRESILREALLSCERQRFRNEETERARKEEILRCAPQVAELARERERLLKDSLRQVLAGGKADADLVPRMEAQNGRIRQALKEAGYPEDYLEPVYRCAKCRDTGYTGDVIREPCTCVRKEAQRLLRREIGLDGGEQATFETFDPTVFSDEPLPGSAFSQRTYMNEVRRICERWAEGWPERQGDLLLLGASGLGKTFLLRCMADRLLQKDANVLLVSAGRFLETARNHLFGQENVLEEMKGADVLMLDDLGSEPMMQNITIESLFDLIETRQNRSLPTVFSTNLNEEELRARYTERIASRITGRAKVIPLQGRDIRRAGRS